MRLSEFLRSPYSSTELCSILPVSILEMDPELEWEDPDRSPESMQRENYPEEIEISFQKSAAGCRFSFETPDSQSNSGINFGSGAQASQDGAANPSFSVPSVHAAAASDADIEAHEPGSLNTFHRDPHSFRQTPESQDDSWKSSGLSPARDLKGSEIPMNSEIKLYRNGAFLGMICYEMQQERATLITLEPTEDHNEQDRDFVFRASATLKSPGINWYAGYGWGALAQIRSDEEDCSILVFKESESRYTMEFYYPGGLEELGESL